MYFLKRTLLFVLSIIISVLTTSAHENTAKYYQDLTIPINKVVKNGTKDDIDHLRDALTLSNHVYYSTDLLLNNIADILPVMKLINQSLPNEITTFQFMLSMKYTTDKGFMWERLQDAFYNLSMKLPPDTCKMFDESLSIVLDWQMETCTRENFFYSPFPSADYTYSYDNKEESSFKFVYRDYVKNFFRFYCQNSYQSVPSKISIGVAYNETQIECSYLKEQLKDADFTIVGLKHSLYDDPFLTFRDLQDRINSITAKNNKFLRDAGSRISNKPIYLFAQIDKFPAANQVSFSWNQSPAFTLERAMSETKSFYIATEAFINKTGEKYQRLFLKFISDFQQHHQNYKSVQFIIQNSKMPSLEEKSLWKSDDLKIPQLFADESTTSACDLKFGLGQTGSGSVAVNERTWRAAARFKNQINNDDFCDGAEVLNSENTSNEDTYKRNVNITLIFSEGIRYYWNSLAGSMASLVRDNPRLSRATLASLIFSEDDLKNSFGSGMHKTRIGIWLMMWSGQYQIGCVVKFSSVQDFNGWFTDERYSSVKNLPCGESFDLAQVIVWNLNENTRLDAVVVARELFMEKHPDKTVLLQISKNNTETEKWARFYGVPFIQ